MSISKQDRAWRRRLQAFMKKHGFDTCHDLGVASIATTHYFEGIRCNGVEKRASIVEDLENAKRGVVFFQSKLAAMSELIQLIDEFPYSLCPTCEGKQGEMIKHGRNNTLREWNDCTDCRGIGFKWGPGYEDA